MPNLTRQERQDAYNANVEDVSYFSGRISELCKIVWAGALAIFYALVTAEPTSAAAKFIGSQRSLLFIAAIAGASAFLFDYLQNICAYIHAAHLAAWIKSRDTVSVDSYNTETKSFWTGANKVFFIIKNLAVLIAASLVAFVILVSFLRL